VTGSTPRSGDRLYCDADDAAMPCSTSLLATIHFDGREVKSDSQSAAWCCCYPTSPTGVGGAVVDGIGLVC
jgi:hypothetical protein